MTDKQSINDVNKEIEKLQRMLIKQLQTTNIMYIDLLMYYNTLEKLKVKRNTLYLESI